MTMRWKMAEKECGLWAVAAPPRSHWLYDGDKRIAVVRALNCSGSRWYWVAGWDSSIPHANTHDAPVASVAEAKMAAIAYVKENLPKPQPAKGGAAKTRAARTG